MRQPLLPVENELLRNAAQMSLEDRARLAEVVLRHRDEAAATALMTSVWGAVRVEGRTATLPDSAGRRFYFASDMRPFARILLATLALQPEHPLVGPLVETLAQRSRAHGPSYWDTQDYASAIAALSAFDALRRAQGSRAVTVTSPVTGRALMNANVASVLGDSVVPLTGLLATVRGGHRLRVSLRAGPGDAPVYYYLTVTEVPATQPVRVSDNGISVERWYEHADGPRAGRPLTSVAEGALVRVRLRITVPATRSFIVLDDALPAGLEAIDLSLRTASAAPGPGSALAAPQREEEGGAASAWGYGTWDSGWWSPFDHRELRDDRVVYSATLLWAGTYTATYLARATTPGTFIRPPAHAEEMYNPGVHGRSDGGAFVVTRRAP